MNPNQHALDRFVKARLYAITTPPPEGPSGYAAMVRAACAGGAGVIQFRDKQVSGRERYDLAARLRKICHQSGALFIVNDALEVALAAEADGVHLGQDDLPVATAKKLLHPMGVANFLVGCSTHSLEQAEDAARQGADYIAVGPVFATPTKPAYHPVGLELVRTVTRRVPLPHVAIGGIEAGNVGAVIAAGAERVAAVRAVCGSADIASAARTLLEAIETAQAVSR